MKNLEHAEPKNVSLERAIELFCSPTAWRAGGAKHSAKFSGSVEVSDQAGRRIYWLESAGVEISTLRIREIGVIVVFLHSIPISSSMSPRLFSCTEEHKT